MTEERIKELAEKAAVVLDCKGLDVLDVLSLENLIRTVAAEAREEGIKEGMKRNQETVDEMDYPPTLRR